MSRPMTDERTIVAARQAWDEYREGLDGVGSSDAPPICGFGPKKADGTIRTELEIWLEKTGRKPREELGEWVGWGSAHEPTILREYAMRSDLFLFGRDEFLEPVLYTPSGAAIREGSGRWDEWGLSEIAWVLETLRHKDEPRVFSHLDAVAIEPGEGGPQIIKPVEVKTATAWKSGQWGDDGSDDIPDEYNIQVQHQLGILASHDLAFDQQLVVSLIGGNRLKDYLVPSHAGLQEWILSRERSFLWRVDNDEAPEPQGTDDRLNYLTLLYPDPSDREIAAEPDHQALAERIRRAQLAKKAAEAEEAAAKADMMELMKETRKVRGAGWSVSWIHRTGSPSYKSIAEELAGGAVPDELLEKHRGPTTRVLQPYLSKMEVEA